MVGCNFQLDFPAVTNDIKPTLCAVRNANFHGVISVKHYPAAMLWIPTAFELNGEIWNPTLCTGKEKKV